MNAECTDHEWIQLLPTGLVRPEDSDATVKPPAAGAHRGVGGTLPDMNGQRLCNKLSHRMGDVLKTTMPVDGERVDLEWIQVLHTGLVRTEGSVAKVKHLTAEARRGVGGVLLDMQASASETS